MKENFNTETEPKNQNAFPQGRWSSPQVKTEVLGWIISAEEIKARALEQLASQAMKEAA